MRRAYFVALAAAVVAVASACVESPREGDALDLGSVRTMNCGPAPAEGSTTFGDTVLRNRGGREITIVSVTLVDADNLTLAEAALLTLIADHSVVAVGSTSDPDSLPAGWESRRPAEDTLIGPGEDWNLILVVDSDSAETGSARAARVHYQDGQAISYWQDTLTTILVTSRPCRDVLAEMDW